MTGLATIGVVAHLQRLSQAEALADQVQADYIAYDDGTLGCEGNHRRVWEWHAEHPADWAITMEDDAQPVEHFRYQLEQALTQAPTPIVSLYLGTGNPPEWEPAKQLAINNAIHADANWIISHHLLHAVAVCIRTEHLPSLLQYTSDLPADFHISRWAEQSGHMIAYTHPSLVDHNDGPTLVKHPDGKARNKPRKAWLHGTRDTWNTSKVGL